MSSWTWRGPLIFADGSPLIVVATATRLQRQFEFRQPFVMRQGLFQNGCQVLWNRGQRPFSASETRAVPNRVIPVPRPDAVVIMTAFGPRQHRRLKRQSDRGAELAQ